MTLDAQTHQDIPFDLLVEELHPDRDLSHQPLFQVVFALREVVPLVNRSGITFDPVNFHNETAKFDLFFEMVETTWGLTGTIEYNTDLFEEDTVVRMARHFMTLLEGIVTTLDLRISELPILTESEQHQILIEWNDTARDYPENIRLHEMFEKQVERTPDAIAIVCQEQRLTYQELNRRANQLGHYLRTMGVGPEVLVGICMKRSLEMVVGVLGILKAGGAYVPLDPSYPKDRLAFIMEDSQIPILLTQNDLVDTLPQRQAHIICLDTDWELIAKEDTSNPINLASPSNLVYILYTSGSTGKPKGVAIEHHSPVVLIHWALEVYTADQLTGVLASTSLCFDLSVFELFVPLSGGGRVILAENALEFPDFPASGEVTLINTVPSAISELLKINGIPENVRVINLAGEPLQRQLVQQLYQSNTIHKVFNLYGPSEDTTYSTFALVEKGSTKPPSIGCPIANTQIYILDRHLQPVPIGVPGEIYIGGAGTRPRVSSSIRVDSRTIYL